MEKREVLVAKLDSAPVGSVSINQHDAMPGLLHLFALDVASPFQRRGIGAALVETVERQAPLRQLDGVWLDVAIDNTDAMRLYKRLGYRREGSTVVNRWSYIDEQGAQREMAETCFRMFKRFDPPPSARALT